MCVGVGVGGVVGVAKYFRKIITNYRLYLVII
jgi:hypothetical protein